MPILVLDYFELVWHSPSPLSLSSLKAQVGWDHERSVGVMGQARLGRTLRLHMVWRLPSHQCIPYGRRYHLQQTQRSFFSWKLVSMKWLMISETSSDFLFVSSSFLFLLSKLVLNLLQLLLLLGFESCNLFFFLFGRCFCLGLARLQVDIFGSFSR